MKPRDQLLKETVREWLAKADEDIEAGQALLDTRASFPSAIGFHAQQAVEKCLKAFLVGRQIEFSKTHDLVDLLDRLAVVDPDLAADFVDAAALYPYAVEARYPGDIPPMTREEAERAVALARRVREAIEQSVS